MFLSPATSNNRWFYSAQLADFKTAVSSESADLTLYAFDSLIFETELDEVGGYITLFSLRDMVEEYMRSNNLAYCRFTISVTGGGETILNVIYARDIYSEPASEQFKTAFLTTADTSVTYEGYTVTLPFLTYEEEAAQQLTFKFTLVYRNSEGNLKSSRWDTQGYAEENPAEWQRSLVIDWQDITSHAEGKPLALNIEILSSQSWKRKHTVYVIDGGEPDIAIYYLNAFNAWQTAFLLGETTVKSTASREVAEIGGEKIFYDVTSKREFVFETAAMNNLQQRTYEDVIASPKVRVTQRGGTQADATEILITESECEMKESDNEMPRGKFTFEYKSAPKREMIRQIQSEETTIFTSEFAEPFA